MKGLELSESYYNEVALPAINGALRQFPDVKIACGLVGEGSQCFGFDDALSQDHDFGPGFCIWLSDADYETAGSLLTSVYDSLPKTYRGFDCRNLIAEDRLGVMTIGDFYSRFTGFGSAGESESKIEDSDTPEFCRPVKLPGLPETDRDWLFISEPSLAAATNGKIFRDDKGVFTAVRERLLAFYPEDVLRKKLAARAAVMSQAGQYNLLRVIKRGDQVAAMLAAARFTEAALSMIYLLNRRYMPFYKWAFRGAVSLPLLADCAEKLAELPTAAALTETSASSLRKTHRQVFEITEEICATVSSELRKQGFSASDSSFLQDHLGDIMRGISDPQIRALPAMWDCSQ